MARSFTGSTDKAKYASFGRDISGEGTVFVWYYPTTADTDSVGHALFMMRNASPTRLWYAVHGGDNKFYADWHNSGTSRAFSPAQGSYSWIQNGWNSLFWNWKSGGSARSDIRWNGGAAVGGFGQGFVDDLAGRWDTSAAGTDLYIGNDGADTGVMSGRLAWMTIWDFYLPLNLAETLHVGRVPPYLLYPQNIVACYPLHGLFSPESDYSAGRRVLTLTGTAAAGGPPVYLESDGQFMESFASAAAVSGDLMPMFLGPIAGFGAG